MMSKSNERDEGNYIDYSGFVSSVLTCPKCAKRYESPVTLPCSHTVCKSCLPGLRRSPREDNTGKAFYVCVAPNCRKTHEIKEYPRCPMLERLLQITPVKVARGVQYERELFATRNTVEKFNATLHEAKRVIERSDADIRSYFNGLRAEIEAQCNAKIKELIKSRNVFLDRVQLEQEACAENFIRNLNKTGDLDTLLENTETWSRELNRPSCEESDMRAIKHNASRTMDQLRGQMSDYETRLFCGRQARFAPRLTRLDSRHLGVLEITCDKSFERESLKIYANDSGDDTASSSQVDSNLQSVPSEKDRHSPKK